MGKGKLFSPQIFVLQWKDRVGVFTAFQDVKSTCIQIKMYSDTESSKTVMF